ncbi:unnamed protein product [Prunus brigantina]
MMMMMMLLLLPTTAVAHDAKSFSRCQAQRPLLSPAVASARASTPSFESSFLASGTSTLSVKFSVSRLATVAFTPRDWNPCNLTPSLSTTGTRSVAPFSRPPEVASIFKTLSMPSNIAAIIRNGGSGT